jgi:hypothetical protein
MIRNLNKYKVRIILITSIVLIIVCFLGYFFIINNKKGILGNPDEKFASEKKTLQFFTNLLKDRKNISYDEMISLFGNPDRDVGSGIYIFEYKLEDGTRILFGFTDLYNILYVLHEDTNTGLNQYLINNSK